MNGPRAADWPIGASMLAIGVGCWLTLVSPAAAFDDPDSRRVVSPGSAPGEESSANGLRMRFAWCPPGKFIMGRQAAEQNPHDPQPLLEVTLTKGFWLGKYEVTQREYAEVMGHNPSFFSSQGDGRESVPDADTSQFPVEQVGWRDAAEFCRRMTAAERAAGRLPPGWEYRLPTEAQWEYACRAGTTTRYSWGDRLSVLEANAAGDEQAPWFVQADDNVPLAMTTVAVGSFRPNAWGHCDMHGNAREWCRDWLDTLSGGVDPEVTAPPRRLAPNQWSRVFRGGSWECSVYLCDARRRNGMRPDTRHHFIGFRAALVEVEK